MRTLIVGYSTRAIAESAVASNHRVITLDYFGDSDQRQWVENKSLMRDLGVDYSALALLEASRSLDYQEVVYTSGLENEPQLVAELARGRVLCGNPPSVLRQVRDWRILRSFCSMNRVPFPATLLAGEEEAARTAEGWLLKPIHSGGGHGVRRWAGEELDPGYLLQEFIPGTPASVAFVSDGRNSVVLALTEQLVGMSELGATGYRWCGNMLPLELTAQKRTEVLRQVRWIIDLLSRQYGLRGVNGADLVLTRSLQPYLVEVNPRYTGSMELAERAYGLNVFSIHREAFDGRLPDWNLEERLAGPWFGKGIVYSRRAVTIPETAGWLALERRDIPFPGDRIDGGRPVCTVLAGATERGQCWKQLVARADSVRNDIGDEPGRCIE